VFNPKARIERVAVAPGREVWVVDDVLLEPQALVERAVREREHFSPAAFNAYPGLEWRPGDVVSAPLADFFMLRLRSRLGARRTLSIYSRLSLATLQPDQLRPLQRLCHRDRMGADDSQTVAACTLYLFRDAALGGTSFYQPRQSLEATNALIRRFADMDNAAFTEATGLVPAYIASSNRWFELLHVVPAAFNRAVFYDGSQFHSSHIEQPRRLSDDPARGRLTLNGFFLCRRSLA
jgi:hypothetical protein